MNPKTYIENVLVTEARDMKPLKKRFSDLANIRLLHGAIGIISELAEIQEAADADHVDRTNLMEEAGDLFWYMGIMAHQLNVVDEVFINNDMMAIRTARPTDAKALLQQNINYMVKNAGYMVDTLKKTIMYDKPLDANLMKGYLRGMDYNINQALRIYGLTSQDARQSNINKLKERYSEKFSEAAALNRNLAKERQALETKG